ncbi:MAG: hypothetical protein R2911_28660 [Caldilineaceae bacterium]
MLRGLGHLALLSSLFFFTACKPIVELPTGATTEPESASTTMIPTPPSEADIPPKDTQEEAMPNADELVSLAKKDLAERLSIPVAEIAMLEVRSVTWPDTSLGCAEPEQCLCAVDAGWVLDQAARGRASLFLPQRS